MIRWWPPIAVTAMVVLGLAVGKGATPIDDWFLQFRHSPVHYLVVLTNSSLLALVIMVGTAVAFDNRQGRLAATAALSPIVAWLLVQICKAVFGRMKDDTLAYPSGHITLTVVVWGMVVLAAGAALWSVVTSIAVVALAILGQAVTYHYFTDTIGGFLLGTAVVCVAALIAKPKLTGVNPMRSRSHAVA